MKEKLAVLRAALQDLKRASLFRKALVAETAISKAVDLIEDIVREIEELKKRETGRGK
ncbi:MAG: hypothetical protein HZA59_01590 [Hydrogenophilales bacterium]|nr:hypothetical protein [Hydrogenophilales bacterium]